MDNLVIIGISDTADRVALFVERYELYKIVGCAVDDEYLPENGKALVGGKERDVWPLTKLFEYVNIKSTYLFVAVLWNHLNADRKHLYERVKELYPNALFATIISPKASIRTNDVGENCLIDDYVVVHEHASIGNDTIIVANSFVGPCAVIGDHVFLAPCAMILGAAKVASQTFIGARATVLNDVIVGEKCLVGACSIIRRDVSAFNVVKDNTIKQYDNNGVENKLIAHYRAE